MKSQIFFVFLSSKYCFCIKSDTAQKLVLLFWLGTFLCFSEIILDQTAQFMILPGTFTKANPD